MSSLFRRKKRRTHYFYGDGPSRKSNARRRALTVVVPLLLIVALIFLYIYLDSKRQGPGAPVATKPVTSTYNIESNTFTTPFFELETRKSWEFQKQKSTKSKFVYTDFRHKLAQGELTVYVNQAPEELHSRATRLLPVRLGSDSYLKPDTTIGQHCNKKASGKDRVGEQVFKFKNITFPCDNDATWFTVLVGLDGGTTVMKLKRPDGSTATYTIHYLGSTAYPTESDVVEVVRKFKVR
jgi:hypothetical protein